MNLLRSYIKHLLLELEGGPGVEQQIGIGKNYHTLNPEPITWENFPGLEYDLNSEGDGNYWASVRDTDNPENDTPLRKFADEHSAMFWIRNQFDILHRRKLSSQ